MKSVLTIICTFCILLSTFGQTDTTRNLKESQKVHKWPYFGPNVPPYLALITGYEGIKTNNFQVGIGFNALNLNVYPSVGAMVGGQLYYKRNAVSNKTYSYEAEVGMYGGLVLGLNYNYNVTSASRISGFKPFIGFTVYNVQFFYGYSFYNSKMDLTNELRHNRITVRLVIPVLRLKRQQQINYSN